jgi:dienelactone hydrolase
MELVMGPLPESRQRVPLEVEVLGREESERWYRQHISFQSDPHHRVRAWLYLPRDLASDTLRPAMLCLHPTSSLGKDVICDQGDDPGGRYAQELADRGYVVLAPDYPSFGEYAVDLNSDETGYVSGTMRAIWGNLRAVDLLESLAQVDPDRIGCIGHSLGGHNALFTAAWDERLRAVITSCGFTAFADYYGGNLAGWTSPRYMPRIQTVYQGDPARVPFDFPEILALVAPRPLWIHAPEGDSNFAVGGVRRSVDAAGRVYQFYGAARNMRVEHPSCEHSFPEVNRQEVYVWLDGLFFHGSAATSAGP